MNTKLVVPPMPEYHDMPNDVDEHQYLHGLLFKAQLWGSAGWKTAQREAALADELAEALENAFSWLEAQPLMDRMIEMGSPEVTKLFHDCPAALAKHTAARQMNKEARNA